MAKLINVVPAIPRFLPKGLKFKEVVKSTKSFHLLIPGVGDNPNGQTTRSTR